MPADEINGPATGAVAADDSGLADQEGASRRDGSLRAIIAAIILVVVAIIMLLLLRACATSTSTQTVGDKSIVAVPPKVRAANAISVWLRSGEALEPVLASAGVHATSTRDMGQGLYFVFLADGADSAVLVERLKQDSRVHDAGFVYEQEEATRSP